MSYATPDALKTRAQEIIGGLKNTSVLDTVVAPNVKLIHDDEPAIEGKEAFIKVWEAAVEHIPDMKMDIRDSIAEVSPNGGGKVWFLSTFTGVPGESGNVNKESVDLLEIDSEGMLISMKDVQRTMTV